MFVLNSQHSVASHFLAELRNVETQGNRLLFRRNLERLGEIMAYEVSKKLDFSPAIIQTPMEQTEVALIESQPVIISVMRAAVPFFNGIISFFDKADAGFIGAFRKPHEPNETIDIELGYLATPSLTGRQVLLVDPMLATGKSFIKSVDALLAHGIPDHIHILSVIAAPEGIAYLKSHLNVPHTVWTCALDDRLDHNSYIIPGLGDAGDLCYGAKI